MLKAIVASKFSAYEEEMAELEKEHPEKLNPGIGAIRKVKPTKMAPVTNQKEINELINASSAPLEEVRAKQLTDYANYSQEEINALLNCDYDPTKFNR